MADNRRMYSIDEVTLNIDLNTKTGEVIDLIKESIGVRGGCMDGPIWMEKYKDLPFIKCVRVYLKDAKATPDWAMWLLVRLGKHIVPELREEIFTKIQNPMAAYHLYVRMDWLTDEEDVSLKAKFEGKLPQAEYELAQGIRKRKKVIKLDV